MVVKFKKRMRQLIIILLVSISVYGCEKENELPHLGVIVDLTGLDGCGLVIHMPDNNTRLEPVELAPGIELINGRKILFDYEPLPRASICMVGETVRITKIKYLD